jgi:hypothetical protein
MAIVEEHARNSPEVSLQLIELAICFGADKSLLVLSHGVP